MAAFADGAFGLLLKKKKEDEAKNKIATEFQATDYESSFRPRAYAYEPPEEERVETGGQTTRKLLTTSLAEARRRAGLTGRKLSKAETEGIIGGFYSGATDRLTARKALALQKRGQDITAGLGYAGLTSAERMKGADIDLAHTQLSSAEEMYRAGLISKEQIEQKRMEVDKQIAKMGAKTQEKAIESTGGLFGGGGTLGLGCIIISACTDSGSYEVDLARMYRDVVLDDLTLGGYYALSHRVAPFIHKHKLVKSIIKRLLVDRMIDRFEWYFGYREHHRFCTSRIVTHRFLDLCKLIGKLTKESNLWAYIARHA